MFWLREKDGEELDTFLYPTGEAPMYSMINDWVSFESDLPIKLYQTNSLLRPSKNPNILINNAEFMDQFEAHAAFASPEKAESEFEEIVGYLREIHEDLGIPCMPLERPLEGNMPVYDRMVSFETFLPSKQRSFNIGMIYNHGQNFSNAYDIDFSRQDGSKGITDHITFGISERAIAGMLDLHRDDRGLRMLPSFAPNQIQIIPIYDGENNSKIESYAGEIYSRLNEEFRVDLDTEDTRPGKKIAAGQQQGIPLQIGISNQNVEEGTGRIFLRTKINEPLKDVSEEKIIERADSYISEVREDIVEEAEDTVSEAVYKTEDREKVESVVTEGGIAEICWCGDEECLKDLNNGLAGEIIGTSLEQKDREVGACLGCGNETPRNSYFAQRVTTT